MDIVFRKILCPTDFSSSAEHAFGCALAIAARHEATVELLHVTETSAYSNDPPMEGDVSRQTFEDRVRERLRKIAAAANTTVPIETNLVEGVAYIEIVNRAGTWPADLIVIGTHGLTGMKHFLIGSVAEKVVRTAPCPVCTVRHPDLAVHMGEQGH